MEGKVNTLEDLTGEPVPPGLQSDWHYFLSFIDATTKNHTANFHGIKEDLKDKGVISELKNDEMLKKFANHIGGGLKQKSAPWDPDEQRGYQSRIQCPPGALLLALSMDYY